MELIFAVRVYVRTNYSDVLEKVKGLLTLT
jgi:hypothetical protein